MNGLGSETTESGKRTDLERPKKRAAAEVDQEEMMRVG